MNYKTLLFDILDGIAQITLNRPEIFNAVDLDSALDLMHASIECSENPSVRSILITAKGRMFCPGGNLAFFQKTGR